MKQKLVYNFKKGVRWRHEAGVLMVLEPQEKRLYCFEDAKINTTEEKIAKFLLSKKLLNKSESENTKSFVNNNSLDNFSAPLNVTVQITQRCNLKCKHCHRGEICQEELSLENFKKMARLLSQAKVFNINISGGEPLLVTDVVKMVDFSNQLGMKTTMSSNNVLMTATLATNLKKVGLDEMHISLDSWEKAHHEQIRGVKGCFETMINNLKHLNDNEIKYTFVTTLTNQSPQEYGKTIDISYQLGAYGHKTNTLIPQGRGKELKNLYSIDRLKEYIRVWKDKKEKYQDRFHIIAETMFQLQMDNYINDKTIPAGLRVGCPAGILTLAINQNGDVLLCPFFTDYIIGNIFKESFQTIWANDKINQIRSRQNVEECNKCNYLNQCGGCRARSYGYYEKLNQTDPYCWLKIQAKS